jgi:hypothetical protein
VNKYEGRPALARQPLSPNCSRPPTDRGAWAPRGPAGSCGSSYVGRCASPQRKEDKDKDKKKGDDDEWSDPTKIDESALSEEDLALKQNMDMLVERVMEPVRCSCVSVAGQCQRGRQAYRVRCAPAGRSR